MASSFICSLPDERQGPDIATRSDVRIELLDQPALYQCYQIMTILLVWATAVPNECRAQRGAKYLGIGIIGYTKLRVSK
jgi:hypothetical protein